jgi:magnesium transporter
LFKVPGDGGGGLSDNDRENGIKLSTDSLEAGSRVTSSHDLNTVELLDACREEQQGGVAAELASPRLPQLSTSLKIDGSSPGQTRGGPNVLPFEFRALEACLEAACSCLDTEVLVYCCVCQ